MSHAQEPSDSLPDLISRLWRRRRRADAYLQDNANVLSEELWRALTDHFQQPGQLASNVEASAPDRQPRRQRQFQADVPKEEVEGNGHSG